MNWLLFAIFGYFIFAVSAVLDKVILTAVNFRPAVYAGLVGITAFYVIFLMPFGFYLQPFLENPNLIFLSLGSGTAFIIGLYFLFSSVRINEISRISPLFAALVPIFTLVFGRLFLVERLDNLQLFAFFLLIFGGALVSMKIGADQNSLSRQSFLFAFLGALFFALSFVLIKIVYSQTNFLNGYIVGRFGEFLAGVILFFVLQKNKGFRIQDFWKGITKKELGLFALNKFLAVGAFFLQNYATFLGSAALVQAMAGTQQLFLLAITILLSFWFPSLLAEKFSFKNVFIKFVSILLIGFGLLVLSFSQRPLDLTPGLKEFGVSFSKIQAEELGLDWQTAFREILDDLGAQKLRLAAYWTEIEKNSGQYDFFDLDWQIAEAERRDAKIILVVGQRLPRWPECHIPEWALKLNAEERQEKLLKVIELTINRYKSSPAIEYWQVENEPFLIRFGECPDLNKKFLDQEIVLVKQLDNRPVIISDSGEFGRWLPAAKRSDIFGTTMYRIVWSPMLPAEGYLKYPLPPSFFYLKANLAKYFTGTNDIIVTELQAEPWGPKPIAQMPAEEKDKSLSLAQFKNNIAYAMAVGFREAYLWGAEWWYWEKLNGRPEFWEYAKTLF
jgi:uncharacterized membrane protein